MAINLLSKVLKYTELLFMGKCQNCNEDAEWTCSEQGNCPECHEAFCN